MRVHISICFLLVCTTFGLLAGADPIRTKSTENIEENEIQYSEDILDERRTVEMARLVKEYRVFPKGLMMENDDGELVEVTMDDDAEGNESEDETRSKLDDRVFFRLYTRKNPTNYHALWLNDKESLAGSNFNPDKPTHFVTHGWINSGNSPACTLVRDAYLQNGDFNVIVVDWSRITLRPYIWATRRVEMVGKHVAKMIDFLESHARLNSKKTTLSGHSLGAHVMGLAGFNAKSTVSYIVGMDPALPMFAFAGVGSRISSEDADHVQIIHTNAGLLGYPSEIGHSDFYPNGGTRQLGCLLDIGGACSHARSYKFFAESINTEEGFYGKPCSKFWKYLLGLCKSKPNALMGGSLIDFSNAGKYYLSTKSLSPFAKGA